MSGPSKNGADASASAEQNCLPNGDQSGATSRGLGALIAEAEALKAQMQDTYARSAKLLTALKRHRQHSKSLQSTLSTLRQLQQMQPIDA